MDAAAAGVAPRGPAGPTPAEETRDRAELSEETRERAGPAEEARERAKLCEEEGASLAEGTRERAELCEEARERAGLAEKTRERASLAERERAGLAEERRERAGVAEEERERAGLAEERREVGGLSSAAREEEEEEEEERREGSGSRGPETFRQRFRRFRYREASGPREAFRRLRELSRQWLRPDVRTKEQMVEMVVQDQLLAILPPDGPDPRPGGRARRPDVRITG
ncbi:SCAN domain-containing protein 1 [Ornithorhynchus anatinus]|uniref:SCAN domain-containing protein 1 n=1 Tax=Ornithorhynchus anatinus TaxID=9258 RepID=UPI0010A8C107|nr:SCAN domain-containing protein 1 [Ornithorhynchus anatinus]